MKKILRLTNAFSKGLKRALIIINYGDVPPWLIAKKAESQYKYSSSALLKRCQFTLCLVAEGLKTVCKKYDIQPELNIIYCGATGNNIREFEFLDALLPSRFSYFDSANISFVNKMKFKLSCADMLVKIVILIMALKVSFNCRINPTITHYFISYMRSFFFMYSTFDSNPSCIPKLAVISNDHSPFPVLFSTMMKMYNVPRVYVQHAQVSSRFPPLDFEYSILRDDISEKIYNSINQLDKRVYIVSRFSDPNKMKSLSMPIDKPINIIIYLSSIFEIMKVQEVIDLLESNSNIDYIGIKLHPRTRVDGLIFKDNIELHTDIPLIKHVAVVPNSSVVIELLHKGIPVVQYFDIDCIEDDYYGFVSSGVTEALDLDDFNGNFWSKAIFNNQKYKAYRSYNPSGSSRENNDRQALLEAFKEILVK